jgi:hypothetical protein
MRQGDTPYLISPDARLLRDQDEKRSVAHLDEWMADETDAFLAGRASPGRTHIWRHV